MRTIVIGGAGDMGRVACLTAAADPAIEHVVVADRDGAKAAALSSELGDGSSSIELDVTDQAALAAAVEANDLVLSTVGPFYRFGPPVLKAAISAGKHYVDIADDWEPTVEMLELDDEAKAAGVTAIIGMGASPGVSNLLASVAHQSLDSVDALHTVWRGGIGVPPRPARREDVQPSAAIDHWFHSLSSPIRHWRDGQVAEGWALEEIEIDYPGIQKATVWTCGHPEPITLPRTFTDISDSSNVMFARPGLIAAARTVRDRIRAGEIDVPEASIDFLMMENRQGPDAGEIPRFPGVFAYAEGTKEGRSARVTVSTSVMPTGGMGESTCIPMAIVAGMIARGEITASGAMAPEAAVDAQLFFERLTPFGPAERRDEPVLDVRVATD